MEEKGITQVRSIINPEYRYSVGRYLERFYQGLEAGKIWGIKCPRCGMVYVPPRWICYKCYQKMEEWIEVKDRGVLKSWSQLYVSARKNPLKEPVLFGLIQLDGADTAIYGELRDLKPEQLKVGLRLKAVWKKERKGAVSDIEYFTLEEKEA